MKVNLDARDDPSEGRRDVINEHTRETDSKPPEVVILLGDILELWEPTNDDRSQPVRESFRIFHKLLNLPCNKVYVIGNHDHELIDFSSDVTHDDDRNGEACRDYTCANPTQFVIERDRYPSNPTEECLKIGEGEYYFLHGHQLDKTFRATSDLQFTPGWMSSLANTYRSINPLLGITGTGVLSIGILLAIIGAIGIWSAPLWFLLLIIIPSLYIAFPWLWVKVQRPVWKIIARHAVPKYKNVETVARDYFRPKKYEKTHARTIVFGHTHYPGYSKGKDELKEWTFVNTGSWIKPPRDVREAIMKDEDNKKGRHPFAINTFVYIDDKGPSVWQWKQVCEEMAVCNNWRESQLRRPCAADTDVTGSKPIAHCCYYLSCLTCSAT